MSKPIKQVKNEFRILGAFDCETDPFEYQQIVAPFCCGYYELQEVAGAIPYYREWWGSNCIELFLDWLADQKEPRLIYAHNGGKFDFLFFVKRLESPIKIINSRLVEAHFGVHRFRDSYAAIPIPLAKFEKGSIDYTLMKADVREKHKAEILKYLKSDCVNLWNLVREFINDFGYRLTIGGASINELRKLHDFPNTNEAHDKTFRSFYYGGRCQAFESGIIEGRFKVYDVNSMYPFVMAKYSHPCGFEYTVNNEVDLLEEEFYFLHFTGTNRGALPTRTKEGYTYDVPHGEFFVTSHEIKVALKHGLVSVDKIHACYIPEQTIVFDDFVSEWSDKKVRAGKSGDKARREFAKLIMNSSYGKTGTNPENHGDYHLLKYGDDWPDGEDWVVDEDHPSLGFMILTRPTSRRIYYDVAIAASITGAARACLLDAISICARPIYCDTDSIICEEFPGEIDAEKLGAWKLEAEADMLAIAGKKLYAAFRREGNSTYFVKGASKGVKLHPSEIVKVCEGHVVTFYQDAPSIDKSGTQKFIKRRIARTAKK